MAMKSERLLSLILRLTGTFELLAFFAVVMPRSWMEASHSWLGMGAMAEGPLIMFMIRQASYAYGMHGVSLWLLASDVKRYRTLILLNGISYSIAAVLFAVIDHTAGMPIWWTIGDAFGCGAFGVALLWLTYSGRESMNER